MLSPERDPPEAEMRLCNPLFQRCCRSSAALPPLLGQPSVSAAPLQSHLTAENTWLRLTLISFPADSCLTGTQTSFVISCVRLQLPPTGFLILLVLKGPLIHFSLVMSVMEKWKMRPCAHNAVVYFERNLLQLLLLLICNIMTNLKMHLFDIARASPNRQPVFRLFFRHLQLPHWLQTRPLATTLFYFTITTYLYHDTCNPDISKHCVTFHFSLR